MPASIVITSLISFDRIFLYSFLVSLLSQTPILDGHSSPQIATIGIKSLSISNFYSRKLSLVPRFIHAAALFINKPTT
jgi:hypothetical protein